MNKYQEALDIEFNESWEIDIFLEKYPQVQMAYYDSEGFKNHIKRLEEFEKKYGDLPPTFLQKLVDKEKPMKPTEVWEHSNPKTRCKCSAGVIPAHNYCWNCGQKLDWSDEK